MFKQRLLTTLILVPLVLLAIYYASAWVLGGIVLLIVGLLAREWLQLIPVHHLANKCLFVLVVILLAWPMRYWLNYLVIVDLIVWMAILVAVLTFPASQFIWGHRVVVGCVGLLFLPLVADVIIALYTEPHGRDYIVYLLCLVWATDIGAYLAGKKWGRIKLIPTVSPGKTIEGSLGGVVFALIIAGCAYAYFKPANLMLWLVVAICTAFISMLGDLFISMLKRRSNLKDTGNIIPGHGGVLDRLDSLIAALPFFYLANYFVGKFALL